MIYLSTLGTYWNEYCSMKLQWWPVSVLVRNLTLYPDFYISKIWFRTLAWGGTFLSYSEPISIVQLLWMIWRWSFFPSVNSSETELTSRKQASTFCFWSWFWLHEKFNMHVHNKRKIWILVFVLPKISLKLLWKPIINLSKISSHQNTSL